MRFIPGPDLPTGGKIVGLDGIRDAYETGRGTFRMRATARIESVTARRKGIVVTELPYGVGTERVIEQIKKLVLSKKLQGIADIKDLTDREHGLRLVIEIKNGFVPEAILEQLYRQTAARGLLRHQRRRPRRRPAAHARAQGDARGLPRPPLRRRTPSLDVPPRQGRGPAAPRRRPADRDPRHRRGHPGDPRLRQRRRRQGAADLGVRPHRGAGRLHPRHAAAPPDQVQQAGAREGEERARAHDRAARRDPRPTRSCCGRSSPTSSPTSPRSTAPRVVRSCSAPRPP